MLIHRKSPVSGKDHTMDLPVTLEQLRSYGRLLIQDAFPHLSNAEREFIKTGITPEEWTKMFSPEEE